MHNIKKLLVKHHIHCSELQTQLINYFKTKHAT